MDILEINISEWMSENPGINPVTFFKRINYYTIEELKDIYKMLFLKSVRGRNANNFNWIWKKINEKTNLNVEPRYKFIDDLEKTNKSIINENIKLRNHIKKLEKQLKLTKKPKNL